MVYHYRRIKLGPFIFNVITVISYFHIVSTLCLISTLRKYSAGGYASGTDIDIHLRPFVLIAYIYGFIKYRQMIEHTKDQWFYQKHHDVLQWSRNAQNIIRYDNKSKLFN